MSTVLRASPPPQSARPVPRGSSVHGHAPSPLGLPVLHQISMSRHAAFLYPGGLAESDSLMGRPIPTVSLLVSVGGLPQATERVGSHINCFEASSEIHLRCGLPVRGAAKRLFASKVPAISLPPSPLRLLPAGATELPGGTCTRRRSVPFHGTRWLHHRPGHSHRLERRPAGGESPRRLPGRGLERLSPRSEELLCRRAGLRRSTPRVVRRPSCFGPRRGRTPRPRSGRSS